MMYRKIKIENFRGISRLQFNDLKQFNLIVGKNNSCKTSVLESIFLLTGPTNPLLPVRINSFRNFNIINDYTWPLLFTKLDTQLSLEFYGELKKPQEKRYLSIKPLKTSIIPESKEHVVYPEGYSGHTAPVERINGLSFVYSIKKGSSKEFLKFNSDITWDGKNFNRNLPDNYKNPLSGIFIYPNYGFSDNTRRFNNIQIKKQGKQILEILQKIEPGIQDLSVGSDDILYCDVGFNKLVPINIVGEGINRLLSIVLAIFEASDGIVLIDEVENGFHYSALEFLWEAIFESAREFNVQVFATTHSWENIKSYSSAFEKLKDKKDNMRLYRLEKDEERVESISIDHKMLKITIENGLEIR
jgi:predicted ATP-dependent endonuclease of OLD family